MPHNAKNSPLANRDMYRITWSWTWSTVTSIKTTNRSAKSFGLQTAVLRTWLLQILDKTKTEGAKQTLGGRVRPQLPTNPGLVLTAIFPLFLVWPDSRSLCPVCISDTRLLLSAAYTLKYFHLFEFDEEKQILVFYRQSIIKHMLTILAHFAKDGSDNEEHQRPAI